MLAAFTFSRPFYCNLIYFCFSLENLGQINFWQFRPAVLIEPLAWSWWSGQQSSMPARTILGFLQSWWLTVYLWQSETAHHLQPWGWWMFPLHHRVHMARRNTLHCGHKSLGPSHPEQQVQFPGRKKDILFCLWLNWCEWQVQFPGRR